MKTTALAATRGISCRTIWRAARPTAGEKTALAGFCDRYQILVFALALWNGRDPILKERLFGLNPSEGNHGEDVKEYYFYLDGTPTHSYMRMLYKYPQAEYPYAQIVAENRRRTGHGPECELLDMGVFEDDRYFDVFVEYAKSSPEDIVIRIEAFNRGPEDATLELLPHLWFRNTWAWTCPPRAEPAIRPGPSGADFVSLEADDRAADPPENLQFEYRLGRRYLYALPGAEALFTDNETHAERVSRLERPEPQAARQGCVPPSRHRRRAGAVNPARVGTKACLRYKLAVRCVTSGSSATFCDLRLFAGSSQRAA